MNELIGPAFAQGGADSFAGSQVKTLNNKGIFRCLAFFVKLRCLPGASVVANMAAGLPQIVA
jgi:hypothetical protein